MGRPGLSDDPRYAGHAARGENQTELDALIGGWTATLDADALLALMEEKGVAAGRVYRAPDMLADPQFAARDAIVEVPHPVFGAVQMQNAFPKLTDTPGGVRWPGPALGEHTDAVLTARAGLSPDEVADLRSKGIV